MSKTELRSAYIGSDDEESQEPFSYDGLIAKSKEERSAVRRQKMEAEAELEDLDGSFMGMLSRLERRDVDADKLANGSFNEDDDLAAMARAFQMENIRKAQAGDRTLTEGEKKEQLNSLIRKSAEARDAAIQDNVEYDEAHEENEDIIVESDSDELRQDESSEQLDASESSSFVSLVKRFISKPDEIGRGRSQLVDVARSTSAIDISAYFKEHLFDPIEGKQALTKDQIVLIKLVTVLFPLDHLRHSIVVPTIKILEHICFNDSKATICHLMLLCELLTKAPKYSAAFLYLAGRLYREARNEETRKAIVEHVAEFCSNFTREALYGPISHFFPELMTLLTTNEPFVPLRLHHFKPVEVVCLEPAFHEDGTEWNGQHREIRDAKRVERQYKQEKKLTVKEMRREAAATESFHAIQKKKEKEKLELSRKRTESKMQQAEQNWRLTKTDQGKQDDRKMKSHKRPRRG